MLLLAAGMADSDRGEADTVSIPALAGGAAVGDWALVGVGDSVGDSGTLPGLLSGIGRPIGTLRIGDIPAMTWATMVPTRGRLAF
jgi:hypothetical protein